MTIQILSFVLCLFMIFAHFSVRLFITYWFIRGLLILWILILCQLHILQILSPSLGFDFFTFFVILFFFFVFLVKEKFWSLIYMNLLIFLFLAFKRKPSFSIFKTYRLPWNHEDALLHCFLNVPPEIDFLYYIVWDKGSVSLFSIWWYIVPPLFMN